MDSVYRAAGAALCALAVFAGCASGGGIFQPTKSSGTIVATRVGSSTPLATSATNPLAVNGAFSIALSEANYSAQFTATITSFTAPTTQSCFTVAMDPTGTVATFTPRAAAPVTGGSAAPSPCAQPGNDVEGVLFMDQQKNTNQQFFAYQLAGAAGAIQVRVNGTSNVLATSLAQPLIVNNGFVLSVSEPNYSGPFTAAIASFTAPATQSCYTVSLDPTGTIATLAPRASPALGGSTLPSPCAPPTNDIESVLFADQRGGSTQVFFENQALTSLGVILARMTGSSAVLMTSLQSPQPVTGGFAVTLSEDGYTAPFTATIVSFTAPTTMSCYTVAMDASQTVAIFTPRASPPLASPSPGPTSPPGPCSQHGTDVEGVLFADQRGHFNEQFFSN